MALFPCEVVNHRYPGPQRTMYPALAAGVTSARRKLRVCPSHFADLLAWLHERCFNAQVDFTDAILAKCPDCRGEVDDSEWAFFCTVYDRNEDRVDYWAPVHANCVAAVAEAWGLPPAAT